MPVMAGRCSSSRRGTELGVTVGVLTALDGLAVALQAVALRVQQLSHPVAARLMTLVAQRLRQLACALGRPPQRRLGIPTRVRADQPLQRRRQSRVTRDHRFAAPTRPADASQRLGVRVELAHPLADRRQGQPRRARHHRHPAATQRACLGARQQPPLPLVQMRRQHRELARQRHLLHIHTRRLRHPPSPERYFVTAPKRPARWTTSARVMPSLCLSWSMHRRWSAVR